MQDRPFQASHLLDCLLSQFTFIDFLNLDHLERKMEFYIEGIPRFHKIQNRFIQFIQMMEN